MNASDMTRRGLFPCAIITTAGFLFRPFCARGRSPLPC